MSKTFNPELKSDTAMENSAMTNNANVQDTNQVDGAQDTSQMEFDKPPVLLPPTQAVKKSNKIPREELTQELLKEHLELRDDGYFYHKKATRFNLEGDFAGTIRAHDGYYSLNFFGVLYSGKMLSHFYNTGEWVNATRGPRVDADGNPIAKKSKAPKERTQRTAPVFTPEQREAAKKALEEKRAAAKAKESAEKATGEVKSEGSPDANESESEVQVDPYFDKINERAEELTASKKDEVTPEVADDDEVIDF